MAIKFVDPDNERTMRELIPFAYEDNNCTFGEGDLYTTELITKPVWNLFPEKDHYKLGLVLVALCNEGKMPFKKVREESNNLSKFVYSTTIN